MINTQKTTYLDHNATTPIKPRVRDVMLSVMDFAGNPSSIHQNGRDARKMIEDARAQILSALNAGSKDVLVFTSGATEANNMVLKGSGMERIIVSAIEHPSVLQSVPHADIIPVLPTGVIDLDTLEKMLQGNTQQTLISVMLVNNETGVIQPIKDITALAKKYGALVHTDAVQAYGRIPVDIQSLGVDFLTLSGHKIGGPQGIGCLIIANCVVVTPLLHGGNQEKNLRSGTENLAGICGLATAIMDADIAKYDALGKWRDKIENELSTHAPRLRIFGKESMRVGNTTLFALSGASSETQLIALDLARICVSNGSACSSGTVKPSTVITAMGGTEDEATSALRISLGWNTTEEDITAFITEWKKMYDRIQSRIHVA